jgi:hypothetical protein
LFWWFRVVSSQVADNFLQRTKSNSFKKKLHLKEKHVYNNISKTDEKGHRRSIRKKKTLNLILKVAIVMASAYHRKKGWVLLLKQWSAGQCLECLHKTSLFGFGKNGRYSTRSIVCYG